MHIYCKLLNIYNVLQPQYCKAPKNQLEKKKGFCDNDSLVIKI